MAGPNDQLTLPLTPDTEKLLSFRQKATLLALTLGEPTRMAGVWYPPGMWDTPLPRTTLRALARRGLIVWHEKEYAPPTLSQEGRRYARRLQGQVHDPKSYVRNHLRPTASSPRRGGRQRRRR